MAKGRGFLPFVLVQKDRVENETILCSSSSIAPKRSIRKTLHCPVYKTVLYLNTSLICATVGEV